MSHLFSDLKSDFSTLLTKAESSLGIDTEKHSHTHIGEACSHLHTGLSQALGGVVGATGVATHNRFESFAPESEGDVKWFVDGCGYFWAVSVALEEAKEEVWILDCEFENFFPLFFSGGFNGLILG